MLDKSLGNAYGSPAHPHSLPDICTAQAACRTSLAPQANLPAVGRLRKPPLPRYGSTLRAKYRLRSSRGKDIRTTLPPICGTFHSRSVPTIMPKPTTCLFGQRGVRRCAPHAYMISPPTAPDVGGVQDWLGMAALSLPFRTSAHGSLYSRVSRRQAASTPDICHRQTHASGFSVANIAHCASIRHRKCLRLRLLPRY